tara:strand:+ start:976 stop:1476 length:501 start_codon:yes stop_codon:yes gene_type:complete
MASKIKVDQIQTGDGTGTIALQNQLSGMTSASMPTGSVLQVVSGSGGGVVNSSSNSFVDTGLSAAITPSATSSKILIIVDQNLASGGAGYWTGFGIFRGSTAIKETSYIQRPGGSHLHTQVAYNYLDSPNTTSATTYKTMFKASSGTAQTNDNSAPSTITLIEIAG